MTKFADLNKGDKIARRFPKLEGDTLTHFHGQTHTVELVTVNPCGGTRSVWCTTDKDDYGYWFHDLQFSTIDDELARWDKIA